MGKRRILIVDDDPADRRIMQTAFEDIYSVDLADDGLTATEMINSNEYSGVISDTIMPRMPGFELYGWIKEHRPYLADRFLLISSVDQDYAVEAGMNFMNKNSPAEDFRKKVRELVEGK